MSGLATGKLSNQVFIDLKFMSYANFKIEYEKIILRFKIILSIFDSLIAYWLVHIGVLDLNIFLETKKTIQSVLNKFVFLTVKIENTISN